MTDTPKKDAPWIFRTYAGHSNAAASNALYRSNLARGQTGLSIAFDLPTQTGYDPDHILARGEVGKVGVPVSHMGDMRALFDQIPLDKMNTSMTINAPAAWLLAMYVALADEQGADRAVLQGTTQNDLIKEYLSRGTYIYPPGPSLRLISDMIAWCYVETPKFNPMNVCSYHLQEAGATPEQELAYALATAISVLDAVKASGQVPDEDFATVAGRISFFVNAGVRFVTELCKMRAFTELWDEILQERYGVADEKARRFRYGVQVNSLGLTEQQPENNVYRILIEMLAVTLSKSARARAVQLPAWNEALGLPRPWDQQWSLRMQQVMAYETDLLEYGDLFDGSPVVAAKVDALKVSARALLAEVEALGGAGQAEAIAFMKGALVGANAKRVRAVETGDLTVVGVNRWTETAVSPLSAGEGTIEVVDPGLEVQVRARLAEWKKARDGAEVSDALAELEAAARSGANIMPPSIRCAKAGVTTGEWADTLRAVFGDYRGPTGVGLVLVEAEGDDTSAAKDRVNKASERLGRTLTFLVGKPGLDGHSNGAEQIAARAKAVGMEVIYDGIRSTPAEIVARAKSTKAHILGLSILSGSHVGLVQEVVRLMRAEGLERVPIVVGGIIPPEDALALGQMGVAKVYTPKDFQIAGILAEIAGVAEGAALQTADV
jgi:(2R)-ethylmalonyl-CoA mutase